MWVLLCFSLNEFTEIASTGITKAEVSAIYTDFIAAILSVVRSAEQFSELKETKPKRVHVLLCFAFSSKVQLRFLSYFKHKSCTISKPAARARK